MPSVCVDVNWGWNVKTLVISQGFLGVVAAGACLRLVSEDCNSPQRKEHYCYANGPLKNSSTLSVALRFVQRLIEGGTLIIRGD